jgi:hypothetical protein
MEIWGLKEANVLYRYCCMLSGPDTRVPTAKLSSQYKDEFEDANDIVEV